MGSALLIKDYIRWHYGQALKEIWELERDFLWFGYHFFSIPVLFQTLFSPFYRIRESYKGWASFEALLENAVANVVSRFVGLFLRLFVIAFGIIFEIVIFLLLIPAYTVWILFPVLIPALIYSGFILLF